MEKGHLDIFRYVTAPHSETYRSIMDVFLDAKKRYVIELRPEQIVSALDEAPSNVGYHLDQLVRWGNLSRSHDTSAVSRIEDFYKRRHRFHLTSAGEVAHRALREVQAKLEGTGSLQTSMLVGVRDALAGLAEQAASPSPPAAERLVQLLHGLRAAFDPLTSEATRFIGHIGGHLSADRSSSKESQFVLYKRALLAYVSRFVDELRRTSGEIADLIVEVNERDFPALVRLAISAADLPPSTSDDDASRRWIDEQIDRWEGIRAWFVGIDGPPTVERLSDVAVGAVVELTRSLGRLTDQRGRAVDRQADFITLARWFSKSGSDDEAHTIFHAAFGLHGSRHLHLEEEDAELTSKHTSWWDAPAAPVPVRLRTQGNLKRSGGPSSVSDLGETRRWMAQLRRREREREDAALRKFVDVGQQRLSDLGELNQEELDVFLSMIDETLICSPDAGGIRKTRTSDGRLELSLMPPDPQDDSHVIITTPNGRIRCRNYLLEVAERRKKTPALRRQPSTEEAA